MRELDTWYYVIEREKTSIPIHKYFPGKGGELDALKNVLEEESAWRKGVIRRETDNSIESLEKDGCFFAKELLPVF